MRGYAKPAVVIVIAALLLAAPVIVKVQPRAVAQGQPVAAAQAQPATATREQPQAMPWVALNNDIYNPSLRALVILFVLAVLIESALAVIFNWRLYLALFYNRGVKTLVTLGVCAWVVWTFNIDVVGKLLEIYGFVAQGNGASDATRLLTALILAGGSAGVYRLLVALGYREERSAQQLAPAPKGNKAWVSVQVKRRDAVGPIYVRITDAGPVTPQSPGPLAGVIAPTGFWRTVRSAFLLDQDRFPKAGGHEVDVGKEYKIEIEGKDADGKKIPCDIDGTYSFADRAIIDFRAVL